MSEKKKFSPEEEKRIEPLDSALPLSTFKKEESPENPEQTFNTVIDAKKFITYLEEHLSPRDFRILVGYAIEGKTFEELGKEFTISTGRAQQIYHNTVKTAKHDFSTAREYGVIRKKPKEIIYENVNDVDDSLENKEGRRKLDELGDLLLSAIIKDTDNDE